MACGLCTDMKRANERLQEGQRELMAEHERTVREFTHQFGQLQTQLAEAQRDGILASQYNARLIETLETIAGPGAREKLHAMLNSEAFFDGGPVNSEQEQPEAPKDGAADESPNEIHDLQHCEQHGCTPHDHRPPLEGDLVDAGEPSDWEGVAPSLEQVYAPGFGLRVFACNPDEADV